MELFNGLYGELKFDYSKKIPIFDLDLSDWWSNIIFGELNEPTDFEEYTKSEVSLQLTYIPGQRYYYKKNKIKIQYRK